MIIILILAVLIACAVYYRKSGKEALAIEAQVTAAKAANKLAREAKKALKIAEAKKAAKKAAKATTLAGKIDTDGNGRISTKEVNAYEKKMKAEKKPVAKKAAKKSMTKKAAKKAVKK